MCVWDVDESLDGSKVPYALIGGIIGSTSTSREVDGAIGGEGGGDD